MAGRTRPAQARPAAEHARAAHGAAHGAAHLATSGMLHARARSSAWPCAAAAMGRRRPTPPPTVSATPSRGPASQACAAEHPCATAGAHLAAGLAAWRHAPRLPRAASGRSRPTPAASGGDLEGLDARSQARTTRYAYIHTAGRSSRWRRFPRGRPHQLSVNSVLFLPCPLAPSRT